MNLLWKLLLYFHITHTQRTQEFPKAITMDYCQNSSFGTPNINRNYHSASVLNKGSRKGSVSFLVKSKLFLVDQKELAHMTWSVGKLETQLQCTQIRVTTIYYLQTLLAFKGIQNNIKKFNSTILPYINVTYQEVQAEENQETVEVGSQGEALGSP